MQGLLLRIKPAFQVNFHSYGNLLLYSFGWQVQTPSADDPVFVALSGTDDNPAIPGFDPGVGADLYTTNGETTDFAHAKAKTLAWTPELGEGVAGNGFVFPDDEALIEAEFQKTLAFDLDVAKSAPDPAQSGVAPRPDDEAVLSRRLGDRSAEAEQPAQRHALQRLLR